MQHIIDLIQINEADMIGSASNKKIKYASDIDLEEYVSLKGSLNEILKIFQEKFKKAKASPNIWITDFKCGENDNGMPLRWTYSDIMKGYLIRQTKISPQGQKVYFIDQLKKKSIIKLDVIALINNKLKEFSSNYYFTISSLKHSTEPIKYETVARSLITDAIQLQQEDNYLKSLKRIFVYYKTILRETKLSYKKQETIKNEQKKLIELFNSEIGKLYYFKNQLNIIKLMYEQKFKPINKDILIYNLEYIMKSLPQKYHNLIINIIEHSSNMVPYIDKAQQIINADVNIQLFHYLKENIINISPINIYNQYNGN